MNVTKFAKPPKVHKSNTRQYSYKAEEFLEMTTMQEEKTLKPTINKQDQQTQKQTSIKTPTQTNAGHTTFTAITNTERIQQNIMAKVQQSLAQQITQQIQTEIQPIRQKLLNIHTESMKKYAQVIETTLQMQAQLANLFSLFSPTSTMMKEGGK